MKSFKLLALVSFLTIGSLATMAQKENTGTTSTGKPAGNESAKPVDPMVGVKMMYINVTAVSNVKGACTDILLNLGVDENIPAAVGKKLPEVIKQSKNNVMTFLDAMYNVGFRVVSVTSEKDGDTVYTHYLLMQTNPQAK